MSKSQNRSITIAFTFVFAIVISFITLSCLSNVNVNALGITVNSSTYIANKGDKVTISATGNGGSNLTYQFEVKAPGTSSWKTIKNYSSSNQTDYTLNASGTYQFRGTVKDGSSPPVSVNATINITVYDLVNNSSVSSSKVNSGENITVNGNASGGSGHYTYKYTYSKPNDTAKYFITGNNTQPFIDASSISFMLSEIGRYTIYVNAKDTTTGNIKEKSFYVDVVQDTSKVTNTSTSNNISTLKEGDTFIVAASASGGSGQYEYRYQIKSVEGTVIKTNDYSDTSSYSYTATNTTTLGQFILSVTARDKKEKSNTDTKQFPFEVKDTVYGSIVISGTIDRTQILTPNNSIGRDTFTLNLSASGGTGKDYQYDYNYRLSGNTTGNWTMFGSDRAVSETQNENSSSFTGSFKKIGKYDIMVTVMDDRHTVTAYKIFTVTVKQAPVYNKANLYALLSRVDNWYNNLTRVQKTEFGALTPTTSKDHFSYSDWEKARNEAQNFYDTGNEIDTDKYYNELKKQDELAQKQELTATEESEMFYQVNKTLGTVMSFLLDGIGSMMVQNFGTTGSDDASIKGFDIKTFVNTFSPIFMIFANSLLVVLFGVNVLSTTLQYELFTLRGGAKVLGRLFLSKVFIDLSCTICLAMIEIAASLLSEVVGKAQKMLFGVKFHFTFMYSSGIPVVGYVIDFLVMIIVLFLLFLMFIPLLYFMIKVIIKLFIISFELAGLTTMSPVFFACLSGEETKQYFKNFFVTFLSILGELIFMGIVYAAFIMWYNTAGELSQVNDLSDLDIGGGIKNLITFAIVFIASCHLMVKPPEVFKNLIK